MDLGLEDRVALVTAASKGIGLGAAKALAREGAKVVICSRSKENLATAREEVLKEGGEVLALRADMTSREELLAAVKQATASFGGIDVLVYNTGPPKPGTFADLSYADWENASRLLLLSAVTLTEAVTPHMKTEGWGRLIYVTSLTLKAPIPNLVLSNTVRLAVAGLSKSMATELGPHGVTSNGIIQGYIRTDRSIQLAKERMSKTGKSLEETFKEMAKDIPVGRYGDPQEVGSLVAFLASERATYINGAMFTIDGGLINSVF